MAFRLNSSLAQRTLLLLIIAVLGSLAVLAAGFAMQRQEDRADFADSQARSIAGQVHSIRLVLESVPEAYRRNVSRGLRSSGTMYAFPADEAFPPGSSAASDSRRHFFSDLFGGLEARPAEVSEAIGRYTRPPALVHYSPLDAAPGYWVSQEIDGETWWIVVLAGGLPPATRQVPWAAVAAVLVVLFALAVVYAATISRPLRKLAAATQRIGDSWPEPLKVDGPAEMRELALSFNDMLVRLRQIENERRVLLGGLPHDLRAPLTRLRLRLATLTELGEHPGVAEDIASIDHIVRQFTDFVRGVQPDEPRQPLGELVEATVNAYREVGRDVQLEGAAPGMPVPRFAVRRLLENLIENAVQHGAEPVTVRLAVADSGLVELTVTDRGAGIPSENIDLALEPFSKLDPARGRGGCGLGLAIVRQLVRQLGGSIRLERGPGSFSMVAGIRVE